jgi:hypothetical protein
MLIPVVALLAVTVTGFCAVNVPPPPPPPPPQFTPEQGVELPPPQLVAETPKNASENASKLFRNIV